MSKDELTVAVQRCPELDIPFGIDPQVTFQDASSALQVTGWVVHPEFEVREVVLGQGEEILQRTAPSIHRPLASRLNAHLPGASLCGYQLDLPEPAEGAYWLAVLAPDGTALRMANLQLALKTRPRIFYMHIAKAGGSAVNHMFSRQFPGALIQEHIESTAVWRDDPSSLENYVYLSGHLGLASLDKHINLAGFHLVTVVREPLAQLISHFSWIRRLAEPGQEQRFAAHPPFVQAFAKKLANHDLGSPDAVNALVESLLHPEHCLVDNYQVRHFAAARGQRVSEYDLKVAVRALSRFRHIGVASDLDGFFKAVAEDMQWPPMPPTERVNVTPDFFGMDASNPEIAEALEPLIRFDTQLYDHIVENRNLPPGG